MSPRNLTAVTTSLQLYFRGSWERGLVALILPAKPRNKNSRLHLPDLREEVREKARGAASARQSSLGGWEESLEPGAENVPPPPSRAVPAGATRFEAGRPAKGFRFLVWEL